MINQWFTRHLPTVRQLLTRFSYEYVSFVGRNTQYGFSNFGYHSAETPKVPLGLTQEEEIQRYEAQLYHHVATAVPVAWQGKEVLEVSSGRGGGACYIKRRFQPASVLGVDFCQRAVQFSNQHYAVEGLSFRQGNAEALGFPDQSFDIILNIEASFYYPRIERFFSDVGRILRPGGTFLYADMRYGRDLGLWRKQLKHTGLRMLYEEDITANVVEALRLDRQRRTDLVNRYAHRILRQPFKQFAGVTGGDLANGSANGNGRRYKCFILRKMGEA